MRFGAIADSSLHFQIRPLDRFNSCFNSTQTVSFACTGLPALATCQFAPPSVTLDGTHTSAPVSVTINTTADTLMVPALRLSPPEDSEVCGGCCNSRHWRCP